MLKIGSFLFALLGCDVAWSCAVCFKDPNSPMTKGIEMGVWVLLAVIAVLLVIFGKFFIVLKRRSSLKG